MPWRSNPIHLIASPGLFCRNMGGRIFPRIQANLSFHQCMSSQGSLPDFIVIGAKKCATTSMHFYLGLHPEIEVSREKELNYYSREYERGEDWYRSWFTSSGFLQGEASPTYASFPRYHGVPERIISSNPNCKLIYMVRDPVERIVSDYWHQSHSGSESRPIVILRDTNELYFQIGRYHFQLSLYLQFFDLSQILVVDQTDLKKRRSRTLREVYAFLGVDTDFRSPLVRWERHKSSLKKSDTRFSAMIRGSSLGTAIENLPSSKRWLIEEMFFRPISKTMQQPRLDEQTESVLRRAYKPENDLLRELLNRPFAHWGDRQG